MAIYEGGVIYFVYPSRLLSRADQYVHHGETMLKVGQGDTKSGPVDFLHSHGLPVVDKGQHHCRCKSADMKTPVCLQPFYWQDLPSL